MALFQPNLAHTCTQERCSQRIRNRSVGPHGRRARSAGPSRNIGGRFCEEGTGMNWEDCELNFGAAQVIMQKGVSKGTNTSYCHPLSVSEPSRDTKPLPPYPGSTPCIIAEKALKMPNFSKTGSKNIAETYAIDFSYTTSYLTSIQLGVYRHSFCPF